jgi:hypothetical protein
MALLQNMFGGKDDWDGRESLPSDIEEEPAQEIEEPEDTETEDDKSESEVERPAEPEASKEATQAIAPAKSKLKDLFAPQEDTGQLFCI